MATEHALRPPADNAVSRYPDDLVDAILVVSFGGPEGPDDVVPFLENVTRGRNVPRERLQEVANHYARFGGVSPINAQNRALVAALEQELRAHGLDLPIYLGNRNWHPLLADTVGLMTRDAHLGLLELLRLPPVPREPPRGAGRRGARSTRVAEAARIHPARSSRTVGLDGSEDP